MLDTEQNAVVDKWWFKRGHGSLTTNRMRRWVEQLSDTEVALVEWVAGNCMRQHGYEATGWEVSPTKIFAALADELLDAVRDRLIKWPRIFYHWMQPTNLAAEEAWIERNF
jgi:hypothetical protein